MYMSDTNGWYLERIIWLIAGVFTLASVALGIVHSPYWLIWAALVGVSLTIFALTGFCLMANFLYWLGAKPRLKRKQGSVSSGMRATAAR